MAYPASYDNVLSVASCDRDFGHSWFSQSNNMVDVTAPGGQILSLAPMDMGYEIATVEIGGRTFSGKWLEGSDVPPPGDGYLLDRQFYECPNRGLSACNGPGDHICIIRR